jgi:hypothetical protein
MNRLKISSRMNEVIVVHPMIPQMAAPLQRAGSPPSTGAGGVGIIEVPFS